MRQSMMNRFIFCMRKLRQIFSRSEWVVRLLGLKRDPEASTNPGLILIQIDGLSRTQLEKAIAAKRMPFLKKLLKEHHHLWSHYSGIPSTTPAVQGELFYGMPSAVPAFSFRDHRTGKRCSMIDNNAALQVETRLNTYEEQLLRGGAAYCDSYTGGADKASFCASRQGLDTSLRQSGSVTLFFVFLLHGFMLLRMLVLFLIEVFLAFFDVFRGIIERKNLIKEFVFIPYRIGVCILLRELITAGGIIDAALGLPIIHCNFLGYDEQAHRRGPSSIFAHWTLKGIDKCIQRIWQFAKSVAYRDYEIWIYSDHGQEATIPYEALRDRPVEFAVEEILKDLGLKVSEISPQSNTIQFKRVIWLGIRRLQRLLKQPPDSTHHEKFEIIADGPIAHLYLFAPLSQRSRNTIGQTLVEKAHIPVVISGNDDATIQIWTKKGTFCLPEEAGRVLGEDHPFLEDIPLDLVRLAHHPDAGTFVLFGWGAGEDPLNFGYENGGHGGFGPEETHGFAILSDDAPLASEKQTYLRPLDLRQAVLRFLRRTLRQEYAPFRIRNRTPHMLSVMTYNVHSCLGLDGRLSPERLARIIASYDPDMVALQEVDVNHSRTGGIDQARQLARTLNMEYHFHPSYTIAEEQYGNAVLSRFPMRVVKTGALPGYPRSEPRGIIWVEIECDSILLQLFNTHLGLRPGERMAQVRKLLGPDWLAHPDCRKPVVVCGDFNGLPHSKMYREISRHLQDTRRVYQKAPVPPTWMGVARLDYIFTTPGIEVLEMIVPRTHLTRKASDHFPVLVNLQLRLPSKT